MPDDKKNSNAVGDSASSPKRFTNQLNKNTPTDESKKPVENTPNSDKSDKK